MPKACRLLDDKENLLAYVEDKVFSRWNFAVVKLEHTIDSHWQIVEKYSCCYPPTERADSIHG
jgi:hypothetical protein